MPDSEEAFLRKLRAAFEIEAREHLQVLSTGLLELESHPAAPENAATVERIFRAAHSLKGAARSVDHRDDRGRLPIPGKHLRPLEEHRRRSRARYLRCLERHRRQSRENAFSAPAPAEPPPAPAPPSPDPTRPSPARDEPPSHAGAEPPPSASRWRKWTRCSARWRKWPRSKIPPASAPRISFPAPLPPRMAHRFRPLRHRPARRPPPPVIAPSLSIACEAGSRPAIPAWPAWMSR